MNYSDLSKKYSGFKVPTIEIKAGGEKIICFSSKNDTDNSLNLSSAEISLFQNEVSSVSFNIIGVYDEKKSSFDDMLNLGDIINVSMGYSSEKTEIFKGYIKQLIYEYVDEEKNHGMRIHVVALDGISLMYNQKNSEYYQDKSKTSVFNEIMKKYSDVISVKNTDINSKQESTIVREESSDIEFIRQLCSEEKKLFYVVDGQAYTEKNEPGRSADIELSVVNEGITQFSFTETYDNTEFEYRAFNCKDPENELIEKVVNTNSHQKNVGSQAQVLKKFINTADDADELKKIVNEDVIKHRSNLQRATFKCIGLPELLPGKKVNVKGITSEINSRNYKIESVIHTIGKEGYSCKIDLSGWGR